MEYPKHIKKLIREYNQKAYEIDLRNALAKLDASFAEWREDRITSFDLEARIHEFHNGIARTLYTRYNANMGHATVAYAVVSGMLNREEMPKELLEALEGQLKMFQDFKDHGELREPGDYD